MASSAGAKEAERQGLVEAGASGPAAGSPTRRSRLEMRCGCLAVSLVLGALLLMAVRPAAPQRASSPHRDWEEARRWVAEPGQALRLPVSRAVEDHIVYDMLQEGAAADGATDNTAVIQATLDKCPGSRSCELRFPAPGVFLTGHLSVHKSGVTLRIEPGASLQFIADASLYPRIPYPEFPNKPSYPPPPNGCHSALLSVRNVDHFTITGGGEVDGNGEFHVWEHVPPVSMIYVLNGDYITITNVTIREPAIIALHAQFSQHVLFEDVQIVVSTGTREEGLLIDSCKYVTVRRVHYGGRGLGFVLASGDGVEGRALRLPNMHVLLEDSYFSGGVVMVSAMAGGNFNVTYRYLTLDGTLARRESSEGMPGLKMHARPDITGGESKDIVMEHIRGINLHHVISIDMTRQLPEEMRHRRVGGDTEAEYMPVARLGVGGVLPVIHGITYRNISVTNVDSDVFKIRTLPESPVTGIVMESVHARGGKGRGWKCKGPPLQGIATDVDPPPPKACLHT
eukprot:jgi/Tetstr1/445857/TSEL_033497.t1